MTKQQANEIKKILKKENVKHTPYFDSRKGELRICVLENHTYRKPTDESKVKENMLLVLNVLTKNGLRPKYRKEQKTYQGTIDCRYLIFT